MSETNYLASITVRIPFSMIQELESKSGKGKRFRDRSDAIRSYIALGIKVDAMTQKMKDPKKMKELQEKLGFLTKENNLEKQMETMDEDQLNTIIYLATNIKDKKVEQLLLDFKQS